MRNDFTIEIIPEKPPTLDEILENFKQNQAPMENGKELLEKITEYEQKFKNGAIADDLKLRVNVGLETNLHKDDYLKAHIEYMGLAFYWRNKQKSDIAWYHYAQAQYYLGIYKSWDYAIDHLTTKDLDRQNRAKGGKSKNQKTTKPLMDAFVKVINEKKPVNGWKSKKELISVALPVLEDVRARLGPDSFPLHENLERTMYRWLKLYCDATRNYNLHSAPDNNDLFQ